jgi:hypothetical protein
MNIEELKGLHRQIINLRAEVEGLTQRSRSYSLSDYVDMFYRKIGLVDHGDKDRFTVPYYDATFKLNTMIATGAHELNSSFSSNKKKLISCTNRYIKGLEKGFKELGTSK